MKKLSKIIIRQAIVVFILAGLSFPVNASLIKYNFFSFVGNAVASGSLAYNTKQQSFVSANIFTTSSYDRRGNLIYPGGQYTQVNLLREPSNPLSLNIWEPSATGKIGDAMMFISFFPWQSGSLQRLEVLSGVEGPCGFEINPSGCLLRQDRIMHIGTDAQ